MITENVGRVSRRGLPSKNLDQFFELRADLMDKLLTLIEIALRIVAGKRLRAPPMCENPVRRAGFESAG